MVRTEGIEKNTGMGRKENDKRREGKEKEKKCQNVKMFLHQP